MSAPLFSIVLPTFNRAHILWRAIQSVECQTESNWELVIIDDGSTDDTLKLVHEFRNSKIRVISISNSGPAAARNMGLKAARGKYIAYLDSDNIMYPEFLSVFRQYIDENSGHILWHCGQHVILWDRSTDGRWKLINAQDTPRAQYEAKDVLSFKGADTGSIVHRADVAESVGGWDEHCYWLEDWDFFARIYLAFPSQVLWVPEVLYEYRQVHGESPDGICAEARENPEVEYHGRQYLLDKWRSQLTVSGIRKLDRPVCDLLKFRVLPQQTGMSTG